MACEEWFGAISATVDGEDPGVDPRLLTAHLASCPDCRSTQAALTELRRRSRVAPALPMPDLSGRIVKLARIIDRAQSWMLVRIFLGVVALQIVILAVPALLGTEAGASAHAARHLGAFSVAYAAGLLVVAVRPARARSILPVTLVLVGALAIGAVTDVVQGRIPLVGEVSHVPELVSAVLVWVLAVPVSGRRPAGQVGSPQASLRLLKDKPDETGQETG